LNLGRSIGDSLAWRSCHGGAAGPAPDEAAGPGRGPPIAAVPAGRPLQMDKAPPIWENLTFMVARVWLVPAGCRIE